MFKTPTRQRAEISWCSYRRGKRVPACRVVMLRPKLVACDPMAELRRLVRLHNATQLGAERLAA